MCSSTPSLLIRAARGAIYLADLPLADRLAKAAERVRWRTGSPLSACTRVVVARPRTRRRRSPGRGPGRRVDRRGSGAAHAICGQATCCGRSLSPTRAMEIDRPSAGARRRGVGATLHRCRAHGVLVRDRPSGSSGAGFWRPRFGRAARDRRRRDGMGAVVHRGDAGRTADAVAMAEAGYGIATRCSDAPHMTFNIADAHVGALMLSGAFSDALEVAESGARPGRRPPGDGASARSGDRRPRGAGRGSAR